MSWCGRSGVPAGGLSQLCRRTMSQTMWMLLLQLVVVRSSVVLLAATEVVAPLIAKLKLARMYINVFTCTSNGF